MKPLCLSRRERFELAKNELALGNVTIWERIRDGENVSPFLVYHRRAAKTCDRIEGHYFVFNGEAISLYVPRGWFFSELNLLRTDYETALRGERLFEVPA